MIDNIPPIRTGEPNQPIQTEYPWEVKPVAFRVAAGIITANLVLVLVSFLLGQVPNIITTVIDAALIIGLLSLRPGARGFTLFRAYAGAVIMVILAFMRYDLLSAIIVTISQLSYSGSLILLLQGKTKNWKIYSALGIFGVFTFGLSIVLLFIILLSRTLS